MFHRAQSLHALTLGSVAILAAVAGFVSAIIHEGYAFGDADAPNRSSVAPREPNTEEASTPDEPTGTSSSDGLPAAMQRTRGAHSSGKIEGLVIDLQGSGLAGIEITLSLGSEGPVQAAVSSSLGTFAFENLDPGREYSVEARIREGVPAQSSKVFVGRTVPAEVTLTLYEGGTVVGRVEDHAGTPIEGATVLASDLRVLGPGIEAASGIRATTDSSGAFRIPYLPPGTTNLFVGKDGFTTAVISELPIQDGIRSEELLITLLSEAVLEVHVLETGMNSGVNGALVQAIAVDGTDPIRHAARSDASGTAVLHGLTRGEYRVWAKCDGFSMSPASVAQGGDARPVELRMRRNGGIVGQVVEEATGRPIESFSVRIGRANSENLTMLEMYGHRMMGLGTIHHYEDAEGRFEILDLDPRIYVLDVWAEGYAYARSDPIVVADDGVLSSVTMILGDGATLRGSVRQEGDRALSGAIVRLVQQLKESGIGNALAAPYTSHQAVTNESGDFTIRNVAQGRWTMRIVRPDHGGPVVEDVDLPKYGTVDVGAIVLERD